LPAVCSKSLGNVYLAARNFSPTLSESNAHLVYLATSPELVDLVSLLYYKRGTKWARFNSLQKDMDKPIDMDLVRVAEANCIVRTSTSNALSEKDWELLYSQLTVEELRVMLSRSDSGLKADLIKLALKRKPGSLKQGFDLATGGGCMHLAANVAELLLRIHQFTLCASQLAPEEFGSVFFSGVLAGKIPSIVPNKFASICPNQCHERLFQALDRLDVLAASVPRGETLKAYKSMHEASSVLLGVEPPCTCWLSEMALDYEARIVLAGATLNEREKEYNDALYYLRIALSKIRDAHVRGKILIRMAVDTSHVGNANTALELLESEVLNPKNGYVFDLGDTSVIGQTRYGFFFTRQR